jgi:methylenetetrahydrofolate--tRNA-(uracil-5-)-methyltransferase
MHLIKRGANRRPVVIPQKKVRVYALLSTAAPVPEDVLDVNARNTRPVYFNPLLRKTGVVDVSNIHVQPDAGMVHVIQELPELAGRDQKALLRAAVLATDLHFHLGRGFSQPLEILSSSRIHFVVGNLFGYKPGNHQDGVGFKHPRGFYLALDMADGGGLQLRIARRQILIPIQRVAHIGNRQTRVANLAIEVVDAGIRSVHLKPRLATQPQLHAVAPGLLDKVQAFLKRPPVRNQIIAKRFLHTLNQLTGFKNQPPATNHQHQPPVTSSQSPSPCILVYVATIHILGGGLAGSEAAWQIANAGLDCVLHEMRPVQSTAAHKTDRLAELVCSNSLKSESENTAPWLLKEELRRLDSLLLRMAQQSRVPGGHALTVDREVFARDVTRAIEQNDCIQLRREEMVSIPQDAITIVATGPLTSGALAEEIGRITGTERLFFYDSISPIVDANSVDSTIAFRASRYGKSLDSTDDYLNCPFDREQYERFVDALLAAEPVPAHIPEDQTPFFEACLPIEELARRGRETLRFGPMKPVGLVDPRTGRRPYAVVQLRQENLRAGSYNLVGFQNHMRFAEQARVFRMIPGLERAEFLRYGQIHRNTYINAPALLTPTLQLRTDPRIFFAGQISGVEGYVESIATGLIAGRHAAELASSEPLRVFPRETAIGSLCFYVSGADPKNYQPANITFDLLPSLDEETRHRLRHDKRARHAEVCRRALEKLDQYRSIYA